MYNSQPEHYIAAVFNFGHGSGTGITKNATRFLAGIDGTAATGVANDLYKVVVPRDGTIKTLRYSSHVTSNLAGVSVHKITVFLKGNSTVLWCYWDPANLSGSNLVDTFTVSTGDTLSVQVTTASGAAYTGSINRLTVSLELEVTPEPDYVNQWNLDAGLSHIGYTGGKVGIGTTSPSEPLELNGTIKITDGTQATRRILTSDNSGRATWRDIAAVIGGVQGQTLRFNTGNLAPDSLLVNDGINVGINTGNISPQAKLDIIGQLRIADGSESNARVLTSNANGSSIWSNTGYVPRNASIISESPIAPLGFSNSGFAIEAKDAGMSAEQWAEMPPMLQPRWGHRVCVVNQKIYVIGGFRTGGGQVTCNEEYNPATGTWTPKSMFTEWLQYQSCAVVGGKIYAMGGYTGGGIQTMFSAVNAEYDPQTDQWITRNPMPRGRMFHSAVSIMNKIYVTGGRTLGGITNYNEMYDPLTDQWMTLQPIPTGRFEHGAAAIGNEIYIVGGLIDNLVTNRVDVYDIQLDTWKSKPSMFFARADASAVSVNGKINVIGGWTNDIVATNEEFDPATDSWSTSVQLNCSRCYFGTALVGNMLFAIGGFTGNMNAPTFACEQISVLKKKYFIHTKN